jgi:FlaA1/EpsC-like NDP-sugar epimerase
MQTLSVGQAARKSFRNILDVRPALAWLDTNARAIDPSIFVLLAEGLLAAFCYAVSVYLITQGRGAAWTVGVLRHTLGLSAAFPLALSLAVQLHRRSLRYANVFDLITIVKVVSLSSIVFGAFVWSQFPQLKIPIAVFVVDAALLLIAWGALHCSTRARHAHKAAGRTTGTRAVIVGAGDAGMAVLKELALDASSPSRPVAVVDDDSAKWGRTLYGVPIVGGTKDLAQIAATNKGEEILICIPSATHAQMHDILDASRRSNLPVRSLPSLAELIRGTNRGSVSRRDLRSPRIEDLLRRQEIFVDAEQAREVVGGKTVLISGAGGSIGSELCRQIASANPRKLLLVDKSENSLFYVHREVSEHLAELRVKPFLADVTDRDRIARIMRDERPDIVFHAAAYKHVAMLERHPQEAIRNNVLGTRNIAEVAMECGVRRFVNISTDKAVAPSNYMGLSKKLTELCIQELAREGETCLSNVRFGNVAGSTGSVLRLFWDQIQKGGPVRVTDRRATRYFMSVSEAVHLIFRAAALGQGGETFVFDMGEPLNIYELARTMTLFAGLKPDTDVPIEFIGLQEGEKLTEELWETWEHPIPTESARILAIRGEDSRARGILTKIRRMEDSLARADNERLLQYVQESYPEFRANRPGGAPHSAVVAAPAADLAAIRLLGAA